MKTQLLLFVLVISICSVKAGDIGDGLSKYGRWSIVADAGFSRFDGDIDANYNYMGILSSPNFGLSLEYNLNPNFSIGWNFGGLFFDQEDINEVFTSGGIYTSTFLSTDVLSIVRGRKSKSFGLWFGGGVGFAGSYLPKYTTTRPIKPDPAYSVVFPPTFFMFPLTIALEYNISKSYSLGLSARYVFTNTDHMESAHRAEYNDMWETVGFSLRHKFITKDKKHFRDEVFEVEDPSMKLIALLQKDVSDLYLKVDGMDDKLNSIEHRVEKLEGILANDGPDTDQDGVPDVRDLEPNTPHGNPVDFWGRSIGVKTVKAVVDQGLLSVYFDFDSAELDKIARITIVKVADKMRANPSLLLEIRGYTDSPGKFSYNQKLSQRRSDQVKAELIKAYNISPKRMVANGKGVIPYPPSENLGSRRCDFFFSE